MAAALDQARRANDDRDWTAAVAAFEGAETAGEPLTGEDHLNWGMSLYWLRDLDGSIARLERAADRCREEGEGDLEGLALQGALQIASWGERDAVVATCAARLGSLLAEIPECESHALWGWATARMVAATDLDEGVRLLEEVLAMALRIKSPDAEALVLASLSELDAVRCRVDDAMRKVDAAAALALSGDVRDLVAGAVLCGIVWSCRNVGDWERASQWTDVATRWSERTGVSMYPGLCHFHRCEILRLHGDLVTAEEHAEAACEELASIAPAGGLGYGYRELGVIRLLRGDAEGAEAAFRLAVDHGIDPNPGLAVLRMRRGDVVSARRGLEEALATADVVFLDRPFLLPALVTACVLADDIDAADSAATDLGELAERFGTDSHMAAAAQAKAEVALARGELDEAHRHARSAWQRWTDVHAPYEAARAREIMGRVASAEGTIADAVLDLEAALSSFERAGAVFDIDRLRHELDHLSGTRETPQSRAFMFTDIVDSTRLQAALGDEHWLTLLEWHDRTLGEVFAEFDGEVIKHEGDGFFVVFVDGESALRAGCRIQQALEDHRRDAGFAPDVRIGVHEGVATPRDGDWIGMSVTTAARVAASGGAGDVVCTDAVLQSVPRAKVTETRRVELKGIEGPVSVHIIEACS